MRPRKVQLAVVDMELLSRCDVLVGTFSSDLFRTVMAERAARCACIPPFVSLDAPWCFDPGMLTGSAWNFPVTAPHELGRSWRYANRFEC